MSSLACWANYFTTGFVPQIELFAESLTRRVLPGFDSIEAEGRALQREAYADLSRRAADEDDLISAAEEAMDHGIDYMGTLYEIRQGVVNLFGVGLWHLFEQQLTRFIRHGLRDLWDAAPKHPLAALQADLRRLSVEIDVPKLPSYSKVDELRLLANCAKHGDDGTACSRLRAQRPDLFTPLPHADDPPWPSTVPVIAPLGGEDLYLTPEGFKEYAAAVIAFWNGLADRVQA
jgi:hypothetical protein